MRFTPVVLLLLAPPVAAQEPAAYRAGRIESAMLPATANRGYQLLTPADVPAGTKVPLVIYLHGAGAKGDDNAKPAAEVLPALLAKAEVRKRFPCVVLVPQCKDGTTAGGRPMNWVNWEGQKDNPPAKWEKADATPTDQLRGAMLAMSEVLEKNKSIDQDRVYLTGVSMGGSGACNWAAWSPDHFAAVVACCGLGETSKAKQLARLPLTLFHGSDDPVAPVQRSRDLVKAVTAAGGKARLVEYTGAGHNIAATTFTEKDYAALTWLFAQTRATPPPVVPAGKDDVRPADAAFFEAKVRPVLTTHCAECHGEKKQKGGLRLDTRAALLAGGDLGPAVVPGRPDDSPLVKAVRYHDDLQMPPKGKLPDAVVSDLTEWVKRGAPWPGATGPAAKAEGGVTDAMRQHWAFQPVAKPAVPAPKNAAWARTDIDRFLLARMDAAGVSPAPPADARTLARRLSFDLIGLPPEPERVAAFVTAHASDPQAATAAYVAELLASPRYGERWGRHWLDVARYADTNGSEVDHAMANAWRYRDYVIRAFNADVPFDQFVREQVAGDLLGTPDGLVASGFLVLGPKALAELDKEVFLNDVADEQIDATTKAFLGLTVACARCHDHKFDPVTAKDYAALAGIFKSSRAVDVSKRVATWTERPLAGGDPARAAELDRRIVELRVERAKAAAKGGPPALAAGAKYLLVEAEDFTASNVRVDRDQLGKGIGVVRTRMEYPDQIEYVFTLPAAGEYQLELRYAAKESRPTHLLVNGNLEDMDAADAVTGDWAPAAQRWFRQGTYTFQTGRNTLGFRRDGPVPLFDKWLVGVVLPDGKKHADGLGPVAKKGPAAKNDVQKLDAQIAAVEAEREKVPTALAPLDGPGVDAAVLIRGNPATPGPVAPRGFPVFLTAVNVPAPGPAQSGRRELAEWLVHPANPLTARVIVNRVWTWHFGEGLVRSPDNFGLRGERPSHPELLDWLATWFVDNGWSVKKLNALICTSAAYRQSAVRPVDADPENRLLARWPRPRLDAEQVRDALLAVGGNLDLTAGGSLMEVLNRTYATGGNAPPDVAKRMHYDSPRRSVYLPVVRNGLYDLFAAFDFPEPGTVTGRRDATTVAPQALFLMNSPFVRGQGKKLAERVAAAGDDAARVRRAFELAYARPPTDAELAAALAFVERDAAAVGRPAAWARLGHALLAANEFLYVR